MGLCESFWVTRPFKLFFILLQSYNNIKKDVSEKLDQEDIN